MRGDVMTIATTAPPRFVVLAAIDDSALADTTGVAAARYANAARGAELHFIHVVARVAAHAGEPERLARVDASSVLEQARVQVEAVAKRSGFSGPVVCHVSLGNEAAREILQMAARIDADVVIVGCHGRRGIRRALVGSVAEHVVRGASCPVLVIRDKDYHRMLAPEIEEPCVDCIAKQRETHGNVMWCARHAESHPKAHLHYENVDGEFAEGSMLIREDR
jgi:nucleotide-binding universal stress UspA family protein